MSVLQAVGSPARDMEVNDVTLQRLLAWVVDEATPAELVWNASEFAEVRDWLKTHRAAQELRVKATRIEMIALRKIGQSGLAKKLKPVQASVALWLAGIADDVFAEMLSQLTAAQTPVGLLRSAKREQEEVSTHIARREFQSGRPDAGYDNYRHFGLNGAVRQILNELSVSGETFTIAAAADRLESLLCDENVALPPDFAEPLRQAVRHAIALGSGATDHLLNGDDEVVRVPEFVTYQEDSEPGFVRVPWLSASLEQLRHSVALREAQLRHYAERFEQTARLLRALDAVSVRQDAEGNPLSAAQLEVQAERENLLRVP